MSAVINENTQFTDELTGELINAGYIYIGEPGLDPALNPKTIYPDRELSGTPLANPQRTGSDGRSENKLWIDGRYSIKVTNSAGVQKLIDLDRGESGLVGNTKLINALGTNDIVCNANPTITQYVDSQFYVVTAPSTNTGAMTLKIDSLPVTPIKKAHDVALEAGDVEAGQKLTFVYNSADDVFEITSGVLNSAFTGNITVGGNATVTGDVSCDNIIATGNITVSGTVDSRDIAADGVVLDAIGIQSVKLNTKLVEIGDWDMDADASVSVAHGLTQSKIRGVSAFILVDAGTGGYDLNLTNMAGTGTSGIEVGSSNINLYRLTGGIFDATTFNQTSFNRGWITIHYVD